MAKPKVEPRLLVRALFRSSEWVWRVLPPSEALRLTLLEREQGEKAIFSRVSVLRFELPGDPRSWESAPRPCKFCRGLATDPKKLTRPEAQSAPAPVTGCHKTSPAAAAAEVDFGAGCM